MINYSKFLFSACVGSCVLFAVTSCKDTDEFFTDKSKETPVESNSFDFSTTQTVDLFVDYSDFETLGPVRFAIYATNPVVNEHTDDAYVDETIKPLLETYTDENGKFDQALTLPAYAKVLHIVTGNLAIGFDHSTAEVVNHEAKVVVKNDGSTMEVYASRRAPGPGESTNELGKLKSTGYEVNTSGITTATQVYKEWGTPLGHWNTATGRPVDYLMDATAVTTPGLVLTQQEVDAMYNKACNILPNNSGIDNSHYRTSADITLKDESEVTITALGSFTCWNSSLGYYYYNESTKPTNRMDLNVIMLFPNTQDGKRYTNGDYQNNIGTVRGDAIHLMYYPHINESDANVRYSEASTKFPKGTKIGFLMRTNGWGMMGKEYATKQTSSSSPYNKAMNIWASSTEGMSYANANLGSSFKKPNPNGDARTALFAYTDNNDSKYCILSFEDACDDNDYNDLIFALNPAKVFLGLNDVEEGKSTTSGVYAFEDLWPNRGDYDMNDVMVDYKHELTYANQGKVQKEVIRLKTFQNVVGKVSGLAVRLNTKTTPSSIVMKKMAKGQTTEQTVTFTKDDKENYYYLTDNITAELNTTYIFELNYNTAIALSKTAEIEPFIWADVYDEEEDKTKRWEVHLPGIAPTKKMDRSFFGTVDDRSNPSEGKWYVRSGLYPFGFYLAGASADMFEETILARPNEGKPISNFYPKFIDWATSKGEKNADWYLDPQN
jgi:LruC domain-containing protein